MRQHLIGRNAQRGPIEQPDTSWSGMIFACSICCMAAMASTTSDRVPAANAAFESARPKSFRTATWSSLTATTARLARRRAHHQAGNQPGQEVFNDLALRAHHGKLIDADNLHGPRRWGAGLQTGKERPIVPPPPRPDSKARPRQEDREGNENRRARMFHLSLDSAL